MATTEKPKYRTAAKGGALSEFILRVAPEVREGLFSAFEDLDFTELDDIAKAHNIIIRHLVSGKMSPEMASECRQMLGSATTLAAARAQNVFMTRTPLDGAQALGAAVLDAKARRRIEDADTESRPAADTEAVDEDVEDDVEDADAEDKDLDDDDLIDV